MKTNEIARAALIRQMQAEFLKIARLIDQMEHSLSKKDVKKAA